MPFRSRVLRSVPDLMSGTVTDGVEFGDAQQIRAEVTGLQTRTDQRLDQIATQMRMQASRQSELAKKIEMQKSRQDDLMTGMRMTTDHRLDQVALQMQDMMTMIGRLVNSVVPSPQSENLTGQDSTQRVRQPTGPNPNGNRQSKANYEDGHLGCFECGQMGQFAKEFSRKASFV